jgi:hypothetical protein
MTKDANTERLGAMLRGGPISWSSRILRFKRKTWSSNHLLICVPSGSESIVNVDVLASLMIERAILPRTVERAIEMHRALGLGISTTISEPISHP